MTLTEFLLARIDEDQERAQFVARQIEGNRWAPFEEWKLSWHDEYDLLCIEPSRALAECEGKREIVRRCGDVGALMPSEHLAGGVLANLALAYADHPDYQQEWRP